MFSIKYIFLTINCLASEWLKLATLESSASYSFLCFLVCLLLFHSIAKLRPYTWVLSLFLSQCFYLDRKAERDQRHRRPSPAPVQWHFHGLLRSTYRKVCTLWVSCLTNVLGDQVNLISPKTPMLPQNLNKYFLNLSTNSWSVEPVTCKYLFFFLSFNIWPFEKCEPSRTNWARLSFPNPGQYGHWHLSLSAQ